MERLTHQGSQSHLHVCESVGAASFSQYRQYTEVEAIIGDEESTWCRDKGDDESPETYQLLRNDCREAFCQSSSHPGTLEQAHEYAGCEH